MTTTRQKGPSAVETSMIFQHLYAARLDQERRNREMLNEQLRIARQSQPSTFFRIRTALGSAMISLGQRLTEAPGHTQTAPRPA